MLISFVHMVLGQPTATTTTATADDTNDANNDKIVTESSVGSEYTGIFFFRRSVGVTSRPPSLPRHRCRRQHRHWQLPPRSLAVSGIMVQ